MYVQGHITIDYFLYQLIIEDTHSLWSDEWYQIHLAIYISNRSAF